MQIITNPLEPHRLILLGDLFNIAMGVYRMSQVYLGNSWKPRWVLQRYNLRETLEDAVTPLRRKQDILPLNDGAVSSPYQYRVKIEDLLRLQEEKAVLGLIHDVGYDPQWTQDYLAEAVGIAVICADSIEGPPSGPPPLEPGIIAGIPRAPIYWGQGQTPGPASGYKTYLCWRGMVVTIVLKSS